jgi:hypothetical protein
MPAGTTSGLTPEGASVERERLEAVEFSPAIALGEKGSRNGFKTIFDQRTNMSNVPPKNSIQRNKNKLGPFENYTKCVHQR